jgi:hypothetical protein
MWSIGYNHRPYFAFFGGSLILGIAPMAIKKLNANSNARHANTHAKGVICKTSNNNLSACKIAV